MQFSTTDDPQRPVDRAHGVRVGDRVRVRRQRWIVRDIRPHDNCSIVTLTGLEPANAGVQQQFLTPFEQLDHISAKRTFQIVRPARWRRACRELLADVGDAGSLRTARTANLDLLRHQLEPALAIVRGHGTRVLIADEVGLGKTVQAGLIVAELAARGAVSRVLVLTPAGLREQWVEELARRFNLKLTLFDATTAARHRRMLPIGVNPWSVETLVVTSVDYVKRPEVRPAVEACRWDIVIIDEVHHVSEGSDRHDLVDALGRKAPYVVMLTATPHNGDALAFESLCAIGEHTDRLLIFRRTREEIGLSRDRHVHQLRIRPSPAERRMHAALDRFVRAVQREPSGRESGTWLALSTLRKRALSSAYALERSVQQRMACLHATASHDDLPRQLALPLADTSEFDSGDEVPAWMVPALRDSAHEHALLTDIANTASAAALHESKLNALTRLLRRIREPAIVFTEYRDTLAHLQHRVAPAATVLHGGMSRDERRAALARFERGGILLATDAAGEGLNLQQHCRLVINLELPWNPMRLEQRIGRVDRIGQRRRVHAFHLIASGTAEIRVLQRLGSRVARAQHDIGATDPLHTAVTERREESTGGDLALHASREHKRLTLARQLTTGLSVDRDPLSPVGHHSLVTFAKRSALRARLNSHALVLFQNVLSQHTGQPVALHVLGVQIGSRQSPGLTFDRLHVLIDTVRENQDFLTWLTTSTTVHASFWTARRLREQHIAQTVESAHGELQPGLFDARATHAWTTTEEHVRDAARLCASQVTFAEQAQALTLHPPEVALVMSPSHARWF